MKSKSAINLYISFNITKYCMKYEKYVKDGRKIDFDNYLNDADIDFYYSKAYYYDK